MAYHVTISDVAYQIRFYRGTTHAVIIGYNN